MEGQDSEVAVDKALMELSKYNKHEDCTNIVKKAIELSKCSLEPTKAISELGEGWICEEALAISIYCALKYGDNLKKAILAAVNHDGDSDSTGAITGNILGTYLGISGIPKLWNNKVELVHLIIEISDDLLVEYRVDEGCLNKYPVD